MTPRQPRRVLLLNGNTDAATTDRLAALARATLDRIGAGDGRVVLVPATARFGARYVASRAAYAVASHAMLEAVAEHAGAVDAVALACFGDPGLLAAREVSPVPVRGMAEASLAAALALAPRVALVTGGAAWGPMLRELVVALGHDPARVEVRVVAPPGDALARDPEGAAALLAEAARAAAEAGAGAVVLGGAGLAGMAAGVGERVGAGLAVLDSLDLLVAAAARDADGAATGAAAAPAPPTPTVGLAPALAAAMRLGRSRSTAA